MHKKYRHEIEFLFLIAVVVLTWFLGKHFNLDVRGILKTLKAYPLFISGFLYIFLYIAVTFFIFFSKDVFWLAGAALFGPVISALFICIAEFINGYILFHLARSFGRAYVEKKLSEKYKRLDERLSNVSFFWLFLFRAAPLIPYRFLDLAAGLTKINWQKYMLAVILGSPIKMLWIQHILYGVGHNIFKSPQVVAEYFLNNRGLLWFSSVYIILIIMVVLKIKGSLKNVNKT